MGVPGNVAIIGVGLSKFGENFEQSYTDMLIEASFEAFADAGIEPKRVQAAWLGTYMPYAWGIEGVSGSSLAEPLNLYPIPVTRVSNYCCTGMEAVRGAAMAVAAGEYDMVMAAGVEKMRDVPARGSLVAQHVERGHPFYCKGRTAPGIFALLATRYMSERGITHETLSKVAIKNHENGSRNPKAHFRRPITMETAEKAPVMAEPLRLFDCCPTTDGAAVAIITRTDIAKKLKKNFAVIRGMGLAVAYGYFTVQFNPQFDFLGFRSTREAAATAYKQAGVREPSKEISCAEVHDCFTITEIINYEDLGFAERGEGWKMIDSGASAMGGALPVNMSGGLKANGHPIGASGVRMINEITMQLTGRCGERQVEGAKLGVAHTLGGPGALSTVFVLGKPD
jgi:acetyl-CoA C-acetyltransferase